MHIYCKGSLIKHEGFNIKLKNVQAITGYYILHKKLPSSSPYSFRTHSFSLVSMLEPCPYI